jgi:hypothetical protein
MEGAFDNYCDRIHIIHTGNGYFLQRNSFQASLLRSSCFTQCDVTVCGFTTQKHMPQSSSTIATRYYRNWSGHFTSQCLLLGEVALLAVEFWCESESA